MKKLIQFTMMSAVAVAAFGADRYVFDANRPFAVSNKTLPAGQYQVERIAGSIPVLKVENRATGESALFRMPVISDASGKGKKTKVEFRCEAGRCELSAMTNLVPGVESRVAPGKTKVQVAQNVPVAKASE